MHLVVDDSFLLTEHLKKEHIFRYAPLNLLGLYLSYDEIHIGIVLRVCSQVGKSKNAVWRSDVDYAVRRNVVRASRRRCACRLGEYRYRYAVEFYTYANAFGRSRRRSCRSSAQRITYLIHSGRQKRSATA